jgi:hypothetical protein
MPGFAGGHFPSSENDHPLSRALHEERNH